MRLKTGMTGKRKIIYLMVLIAVVAGIIFWRSYGSANATGSATLSWNQNKEADLASYKVYYGTSPRTADCPPGGYAKNQNTGKNTQYTILNLSPGQTYYFSVTSINTGGKESCFSPEMKKTISRFEWLKNIFKKR
jgi:fibronectin type 3 domain-containing protein